MENQLGPTHAPEPGIIAAPEPNDALINRLVQYYTSAEEASKNAREKAERDRDYRDNKQLTDEEVRKLQARGQPAVAFNLIRGRADFLAGMEKKQRRDPKAYPRNNPQDVAAAEAFTDGLRYVVERADYASKRSQAWDNITIEGFGGVEIAAVPGRDGQVEIQVTRIPWDRLFYDPHSSEPDFSDARFLGQVMWMDYDEAIARAVANGKDEAEAKQILDACLNQVGERSRTYDDKPRDMVWADAKRKRVRVVMIWYKEPSGWEYCEFTKSGELTHAAAPYVDQDGESYCPWIIESANVDRENNRYGELRHLIDPQDEVNKRRSKGLHLLNVNGVIASEGAVNDVNAARRELAKPDFWLTKLPGADLEIVKGTELAAGQAQLGQQALEYIMQAGQNAALQGKGPQDQSGRAWEAQQAGGLIEQSSLMDTLRRFDRRLFNAAGSMIKQFWDAPMWIRVTDDDQAPRWVGLNEPMFTDPTTGESKPESEWRKLIEQAPQDMEIPELQPAVDPETGEPMLNNHVARLDMDIIVSDAPDAITLDGENYQAFIQLMGMGLPPSMMKVAIEMHPGLSSKRKKQLTEMLDQAAQQPPPPGAQKAEQLHMEKLEADIVAVRATAYAALAAGEASLAKAGQVVPMAPPMPDMSEGFGSPPQAPQGGPQQPPQPGEPGPPPMGPPPEPGPPEGPPQMAPHGQPPAPPQPGPPHPGGLVGLMSAPT